MIDRNLVKAGGRYRFITGGAIAFVVRIDPGKIPAWPDPVDMEYVMEYTANGAAIGKTFVSTLGSFADSVEVYDG